MTIDGVLQNFGCNATTDNICITSMKKIVPQVLCSFGGYLDDCLFGARNFLCKSITFSGGTGLESFAVSWKRSLFIILSCFQMCRYEILSYYTIDPFNYL